MRLGPRLVIPGVIFGSSCLALFLFMVTAGLSSPPALAALPPTAVPGSTQEEQYVDAPVQEGIQTGELDVDHISASGAQEGCLLSGRFPEKVLQWCGLITHYATKRGIAPDLIAALILQESGGNESAYSRDGAVGLMQVMPRDGKAASFMCVNGPCFSERPTIDELKDPEFNIAYGTKMLSSLLSRHGNIRDALKSYGPMNVGYYYADIVLGHFQNYAN